MHDCVAWVVNIFLLFLYYLMQLWLSLCLSISLRSKSHVIQMCLRKWFSRNNFRCTPTYLWHRTQNAFFNRVRKVAANIIQLWEVVQQSYTFEYVFRIHMVLTIFESSHISYSKVRYTHLSSSNNRISVTNEKINSLYRLALMFFIKNLETSGYLGEIGQ